MRHWTAGNAGLRLVIAAGPPLALLASALMDSPPPLWMVLLTTLCSVGSAMWHDSGLGTAAQLLVVAWWAVGPPASIDPAVLVAAASLVAAHVASVLVAYGPADLPVNPRLLRTWAARATATLLVAGAAWLAAAAVEGQPEPAGIWGVGMAGVTIAAVVAAVAVGRRREPEVS